MVFASRNLLVDMHQVAPNSNRLLCDKVQQKVTSVCVISSRLPTLGSRSTRLPWENLDLYAFPPVAIMGKVLLKGREYLCRGIILISPGWPNMPWYGDLVTLSQPVLSADWNFQSDSTQEFVKPKSACPAPRASGSLLSRILWGSGSTNWGSTKRLNQLSLRSKVD